MWKSSCPMVDYVHFGPVEMHTINHSNDEGYSNCEMPKDRGLTMKTFYRHMLGALLPFVLLLSGCTNAQPAPSVSIAPTYKSQIDQILANNPTDFEKKVLSDYQITDAEYREAQELFIQCMADQGWTVVLTPEGTYSITGTPGSGNENSFVPDGVSESCSSGTLDGVEAIYFGMRDNPEGLTMPQQIRACFSKEKVPDGAGLSDSEFEAMLQDPTYHPSTDAGILCRWDPTGSGGLTLDQAKQMDAS